jgi:hypothetical protein
MEEGTLCGDGVLSGVCDAFDTCDGAGNCIDEIKVQNTTCRDASGDCFMEAKCDGVSKYCPDNLPKLINSACGNFNDSECTAADTCDGLGVCLPNHIGDGDPCGLEEDDCTFASKCEGGECVFGGYKPADTPCGLYDPNNLCDAQDYCDGSGQCVPQVKIEGTICRSAGSNACDVDEVCDGISKYCPGDLLQPEGTSCGDPALSDCTEPGTCDGAGNCLSNGIECSPARYYMGSTERVCGHNITVIDNFSNIPVVDGVKSVGEWPNFDGSSVVLFFEGKPDGAILAEAELVSDCSKWYVKVEMTNDAEFLDDYAENSEHSVKFNGAIQVDAASESFKWIEVNSLPIGWEASFVPSAELNFTEMITVEITTAVIDATSGSPKAASSSAGTTLCIECPEDSYNAGGSKFRRPTGGPTRAPTGASVSGDPHFKTWSGELFDFHGICDLKLLHNPQFNNGLGMDIHVRSKKTRQWSFVSTAVVRIGNETFEVSGERDGGDVWLNKVKQSGLKSGTIFATISGYPITFNQLNPKRREYTIDLGKNETVGFKTWKDFVRVDVNGQKSFTGSLGLMGSYPEGAKLARDGTTEFYDVNKFGEEWQVLSSEPQLFRLLDGPQHPRRCEIPTKIALRRRLAESYILREEAVSACAHAAEDERDLCIFDVMATNDKGAADAY